MKGTCEGMCSPQEMAERQAQQDISIFEATEATKALRRHQRILDPQKAVKRYRRAADGVAETAADVRPLFWLDRTVSYLWEVAWTVLVDLKRHGQDEDTPRLVELYDFLGDRFQAVRKDMVVQGLGGPGGRAIFQRIVRFHIFFDYLLTQQVPPTFDEHLGLSALRSGLATLFGFYKEAATAGLSKKEETQTPETDHPRFLDEFLGYHVLLQAHDIVLKHADSAHDEESGWEKLFLQVHRILGQVMVASEGDGESRATTLTKTRFAIHVATALAMGNSAYFYRLCRDVGKQKEEGLLVRCLLHKLLPATRRRSLQVWNKVLFKMEKLRLKEVARLLCFQDVDQAAGFLTLHQLQVRRDNADDDKAKGQEGLGRATEGLDAWDAPPTSTTTTTTTTVAVPTAPSITNHQQDDAYIEPRAAPLGFPAVGQSLEERRQVRALLCPRQDAWVLLGEEEEEGEERGTSSTTTSAAAAAIIALEKIWSRLGIV